MWTTMQARRLPLAGVCTPAYDGTMTTTEYQVRITGFMPYVTTEETTVPSRVRELQEQAEKEGWGCRVLSREVSDWTPAAVDA
jgi:hypothetical protein